MENLKWHQKSPVQYSYTQLMMWCFIFIVKTFYHAFVCFADEDKPFVDKLVKKMENKRNLHLCWPERDFLPVGSHLETTALAIERRCNKFIVILSQNYENSQGAIYQAQIATSLAPG